MTEKEAVVLVKRSTDVLAYYAIHTFKYETEDEFIAKREKIRELLNEKQEEKQP